MINDQEMNYLQMEDKTSAIGKKSDGGGDLMSSLAKALEARRKGQ